MNEREISMKWIEVIHLRSNKETIDVIIDRRYLDIDQSDSCEKIAEVKNFRNHKMPTDLNIHLIRQSG